ncbi:integral membrane sensor hybrid histidine kinase [Planoprotostelium fungivorum]|uniref:Integral membrane sensor hybrid histidine kinase n=1 Tax=Planoprotostelium fungivorum TaxID=1890364 RepID=A0A2P6MYJ9_9EUKA|nr:integral membrane sensor hybrid histidine kinase [Planoprotostelium fungivorum]
MKRSRTSAGDDKAGQSAILDILVDSLEYIRQGLVIIEIKEAHKVLYANSSALRLMDTTREALINVPHRPTTPNLDRASNRLMDVKNEMLSDTFWHLTSEASKSGLQSFLFKTRVQSESYTIETDFTPTAGGYVVVTLTAHLHKYSIAADRLMSLEEQDTTSRFLSIMDSAAAVVVLDVEGRDIRFQDHTKPYLKFIGEDMKGKWIGREKKTNDEERQWWMDQMFESMKSQQCTHIENETTLYDGTRPFCRVDCQYIDSRDKKTGEVTQMKEPRGGYEHRFVVNIHDITERKKLETFSLEVQTRNHLTTQLVNTSDCVMAIMEPEDDGHIMYHMMNKRGQQTIDSAYAKFIDANGRSSRELGIPVEHVFLYVDCINEVKRTNGMAMRTVHDPFLDIWWMCVMWEAAKDRYAIICTDISTVKKMEKALEKEIQEKDKALAVHSRFLATISHEVRTPLTGIIEGISHFLEKEGLSEEDKDVIQIGQLCGDQLLTVINDVLDYSRIEANGMNIDMKPVMMQAVMEESVDICTINAMNKGLQLVTQSDFPVGLQIVADHVRLRQVFVNLLSNAIKFTEKGEIVVSGQVKDDVITLCVRDTGIGVSQAFRDKLFQPFTQGDSSYTRRYNGTGLGLSICKRIIEGMEGKIWLESEEGHGAAFFFSLKVTASPPNEESKQLTSICHRVRECNQLQAKSAIVVDGNASQSHALAKTLEEMGLKTHSFSTCLAAANFLDESGEKCHVSILVMDMEQEKDSIEKLMERCQQASIWITERLNPGVPSQVTKFKRPTLLLRKPLKRTHVYRLVHQVLVLGAKSEEEKKEAMDDSVVKELRVMVAEDNLVNQKVIKRLLQKFSIEAKVVDNGKMAVESVAEQPYDLILMDCNMPVMGGSEATQLIRLQNGSEWPKIVALTADAMASNRQLCLDVGMNAVLTKPVKREEIRQVLLSVYHSKHQKTNNNNPHFRHLYQTNMSGEEEDSGNGPMVLAACKRGNISLLKKLIEEDGDKFNPNPTDGLGNGPLHYAATFNHLEIAELILAQKGVDTNIQNHAGDTAVHKAVEKDHVDFLTLLVGAGADTGINNKRGVNATKVARSDYARDIIRSAQLANQVNTQAAPKTKEVELIPHSDVVYASVKAELDPSMIAKGDDDDEEEDD